MMHISGLGSLIEPGVFATGCASHELQEEPRTGLTVVFPEELAFLFLAQTGRFRADLVLRPLI